MVSPAKSTCRLQLVVHTAFLFATVKIKNMAMSQHSLSRVKAKGFYQLHHSTAFRILSHSSVDIYQGEKEGNKPSARETDYYYT